MTKRRKWDGPSQLVRVTKIKNDAAKIADYIARSQEWWNPGEELDGLTFAAERLTRDITQLRAFVGRCTRGHVVLPGPGLNRCTVCGAFEIEEPDE